MIERKIIIGLITSTEYCKKIKDIWNQRLISSPTAKLLADWIWEYYNKYQKAPGKDIETIFYSKLKSTKISKTLAEEIEQDILPSLSDESVEEEVDIQYLLEETEKYLNEQHIKLFTDTISALLSSSKLLEAEKMVREFKPLGLLTGKLDQFILSVDEIRKKETIQPRILMSPWLKEGQMTIIYGNYGCGKSLLAIVVAYLLGVDQIDDDKHEVGEWFIKEQTGCLYLDGELGEVEMEERVKKFEWLGRQRPGFKMKILSVPEYQLATSDSFYLSNRQNQLKIITWLKDHPSYKLVVLDSASTLFGLLEENDNSEWNNKINPFLRDLRALGVACILLHHSGKDNKRGLRGASAMGAMAHNIYRLTNHSSKNTDGGEAYFNLTKDKQRAGGKTFKSFGMHFYQNDKETETHWEVTGLNDD